MAPASSDIDRVEIAVYTVPTDGPDGYESDGTFRWDSTTIIIVHIRAGDVVGLGYTYGDVAIAHLIESQLAKVVLGRDPRNIGALWRAQMQTLRNTGRPGLGAMAVAAVDIALWDLEAKRLGVPVSRLTQSFHDDIRIYGSGGFCNYPRERLVTAVGDWLEQGIDHVKIKIARHPEDDPGRLSACGNALGDAATLMVDANGALGRKQALAWAQRLHERWNVTWFEEPVSSDDREGLRLLRDHGPPDLDIAAGEYGFVLRDFADLLQAGAVDCLQADVTRCAGITGLMRVGGLCAAHELDLSAHCAPAVSAHAFCGIERVRHLEYFHDHVRLESLLFDGVPTASHGRLRPDPARAGLGLQLKHPDAESYLRHRTVVSTAGA